jgi:DNA-binding LacI/PurR family transcriptional regulator
MSTTAGETRIGYPAGARMARVLEERIRSGEYEAGTWLPAERALAEEFRVDRAIVRAALDHLQQKSLIIREPGRRPWVSDPGTPGASRSAAKRVTIGIILPQHPVYPAAVLLLKGIQETLRDARDHQFRLLFFDTFHAERPAEALERQALEELLADDADGLILWPCISPGATEGRALLRRFRELGRPVVYVDRHPEGEACDFVGVDNRNAARDAVEYLLRLGHTRIAYLTNTDPAISVTERGRGYADALRNAGITPDPQLTFTVPVGENLGGSGLLERFFAVPDPPTAVFAMNDSLAHRLIEGLEERGARVPGTLSVIGFDDLERFSPRPALLTTMHQPFDRIGQRAAELLLLRLRDEPGGALQHLLLPTPLIERTTCRALKPPGTAARTARPKLPGDAATSS